MDETRTTLTDDEIQTAPGETRTRFSVTDADQGDDETDTSDSDTDGTDSDSDGSDT